MNFYFVCRLLNTIAGRKMRQVKNLTSCNYGKLSVSLNCLYFQLISFLEEYIMQVNEIYILDMPFFFMTLNRSVL